MAITNRFMSDLALISFGNLIFVSPDVSWMWQRDCRREDSRCVVATCNANERRSVAADDSRPPTSENKNGMNAAGSVMKAAGEWTKVSRTACAVLWCGSGRLRAAGAVSVQGRGA
jgi:hypothetical protein